MLCNNSLLIIATLCFTMFLLLADKSIYYVTSGCFFCCYYPQEALFLRTRKNNYKKINRFFIVFGSLVLWISSSRHVIDAI